VTKPLLPFNPTPGVARPEYTPSPFRYRLSPAEIQQLSKLGTGPHPTVIAGIVLAAQMPAANDNHPTSVDDGQDNDGTQEDEDEARDQQQGDVSPVSQEFAPCRKVQTTTTSLPRSSGCRSEPVPATDTE
jgi:hypothetical protein